MWLQSGGKMSRRIAGEYRQPSRLKKAPENSVNTFAPHSDVGNQTLHLASCGGKSLQQHSIH